MKYRKNMTAKEKKYDNLDDDGGQLSMTTLMMIKIEKIGKYDNK